MLPELFHDPLLRQPGALPSKPGGEVTGKGSDFVSVLAEFDLSAVVSHKHPDGRKAEGLSQGETVEEAVEEEGATWLLEDAALVDTEKHAEEADGLAREVAEPIAGVADADAPPFSSPVTVMQSGAGSPREMLPPSHEVIVPDRSNGSVGVRPQAREGEIQEETAFTKAIPLDQSRELASADREARKADQVEPPSLPESQGKSARIEVPQKAGSAMLLNDGSNSSVGLTERGAQPLREAKTEVPSEARGQSSLDKQDPSLGNAITSRYMSTVRQSGAEAVQETRLLARTEASRFDLPQLPEGEIETARAMSPVGVLASQGVSSPLLSTMQGQAEQQRSFGEQGSGFLPEETLFSTDRSAMMGRDMFHPLRSMVPTFHSEQAQAMTVIRQVSDAMRLTPGAGVDIALSPEELGSVRLSLSGNDGQLNVIVQAERPETLELMRRHIDSLSQEFRTIGYGDVSFSFQSGEDSPKDERGGEGSPALIVEEATAEPGEERQVGMALRTGLDIRI